MKKRSPLQSEHTVFLLGAINFYFWQGSPAVTSALDSTLIAPVAMLGVVGAAFFASRHRALGARPALELGAYEALAPTLLALSFIHEARGAARRPMAYVRRLSCDVAASPPLRNSAGFHAGEPNPCANRLRSLVACFSEP